MLMKTFIIFDCFWQPISESVRSISEFFSTLSMCEVKVWKIVRPLCLLLPFGFVSLSTCCSPLNNWFSRLNCQWHSSAADPARDSQINYRCLQTYAHPAFNRFVWPHCLRLIILDFLRCWNERKGSCFFEKWSRIWRNAQGDSFMQQCGLSLRLGCLLYNEAYGTVVYACVGNRKWCICSSENYPVQREFLISHSATASSFALFVLFWSQNFEPFVCCLLSGP